MRLLIHPEAEQELDAETFQSAAFHTSLSDFFIGQFERTLLRIVAEPERWQKFKGEDRKAYFGRHSRYAIVYSVHTDVIYIKAVMHLQRRPLFYWVTRD